MMDKEEYYKYIEENDTYPEHSHKWIVKTFTDTSDFNPNELFYRNFGTFETKEEAKEFVLKFGKEEFISLNILEEWLGFTLEDWEKEHII